MKKSTNGIVEKMMDEALDEVVSNGWKNVPAATITMACHKLMKDELKGQRCDIKNSLKPVMWLAGILGAGIIWQIVSVSFFGG